MFMGLATPCVALNHHSMVARPILVNNALSCLTNTISNRIRCI
jgi:hypothetical protein